jgi:hypothetical protein
LQLNAVELQADRLLVQLGSLAEPFTARLVAEKLGVPVEEVSLALMRLHRRSFLSRRAVVRVCTGRDGRKVNRGYEYQYTFTKKGHQRLKWLRSEKPLRDFVMEYLTNDVLTNIGEEERKLLIDQILTNTITGSSKRNSVKELALPLCSILAAKNRELRGELEDKTFINLYLLRRYQYVLRRHQELLDYLRSGEWLKELAEEVGELKKVVKDIVDRNDLMLQIFARCVQILVITIKEAQQYLTSKLSAEDYDTLCEMTTVASQGTLLAMELIRSLLSTSKV